MDDEETGETTSMAGMNTLPTPIAGVDNSFRLLKREGELMAVWTMQLFIVPTLNRHHTYMSDRDHQRNPNQYL